MTTSPSMTHPKRKQRKPETILQELTRCPFCRTRGKHASRLIAELRAALKARP
jgi:hypothetical protein